jgi:AcrR family transcriptional regulator
MTSFGKRWKRRKEMRPDEILAAAAEEISEKGQSGLRVAAVAARAGVAKGTVYLYYRSKQQLLDALRGRVDNCSPVDGGAGLGVIGAAQR